MMEALVKQRALEIGFDLVGVAPIAAAEALKFSREWVERGYGGEMRYLENPMRDDPRKILSSVRSAICVGLVYNADFPYSTEVGRTGSRGSGVGSWEAVPGSRGGITSDQTPTRDNGQRTKDDFPRGWISRYAWGTDYHKVMRAKLEQLRAAVEALSPTVETRVYVDTGPIVERAFARLAGLGWVGKNTCLINEAMGSWFFLGVMLTSLELGPDLAAPDRCGSCTACIDACPTDALVQPYVMDASRCISYLTIELKGSIPKEFRSAMGANVVGCDICQDVCPWNSTGSSRGSAVGSAVGGLLQSPDDRQRAPRGEKRSTEKRSEVHTRQAATTNRPEFQPMEVDAQYEAEAGGCSSASGHQPPTFAFSLFNPPLEALAAFTEEDFRRIFRHSPVKRVKYRGWLRNLCVAMGNAGDLRFLPRLERLREHGDPVIREHAAWAITKLAQTTS